MMIIEILSRSMAGEENPTESDRLDGGAILLPRLIYYSMR